MKMYMVYGLTAVLPAVIDDSVAVFKLFLLRNFSYRFKHMSYFGAV